MTKTKRPGAAVFELQANIPVQIRLTSTDLWINGTIESIDTARHQIFVVSNGDNFQFAYEDYPNLIRRK